MFVYEAELFFLSLIKDKVKVVFFTMDHETSHMSAQDGRTSLK